MLTSCTYLHCPQGHLLDVGCGSGNLLKRFAEAGCQVEGIDLDPSAVENARSKGLQVRVGALEEQQHPDNYFDVIIMNPLIEHVHEPLYLLQEPHRILKPKGYIVITTPNSKSWGYKLYKSHWLHLDPPQHLHLFNPLSICRLTKG